MVRCLFGDSATLCWPMARPGSVGYQSHEFVQDLPGRCAQAPSGHRPASASWGKARPTVVRCCCWPHFHMRSMFATSNARSANLVAAPQDLRSTFFAWIRERNWVMMASNRERSTKIRSSPSARRHQAAPTAIANLSAGQPRLLHRGDTEVASARSSQP